MGYFPGYDMEPCWYCGSTDCTGNHQGPAADAAAAKITHFQQGFGHPSCPCQVCKDMRNRPTNRKPPMQMSDADLETAETVYCHCGAEFTMVDRLGHPHCENGHPLPNKEQQCHLSK